MPREKEENLKNILENCRIDPQSEEYRKFLSLDESEQKVYLLKKLQEQHIHNEYTRWIENTQGNLDGVSFPWIKLFTPSPSALVSLLYLQSMGIMETPDTHYTRRKDLSSYLLLETLSGRGTVTYKGKTVSLLPGDLILLDCRTEHYYGADQVPWTYRLLHFNGNAMSCLYQPLAKSSYFYFKASLCTEIRTLVDQIFTMESRSTPDEEIRCNKLLTDCVTGLVLLCPGTGSDMPEWISQICTYLEEDLSPGVLTRLEKKFYRSRYYIAHAFKEYTGQTVLQYQTGERMKTAAYLLQNSGLTVSEIALMVGYENAASFDKAFRKRYSLSPGAFRTHHKKQSL